MPKTQVTGTDGIKYTLYYSTDSGRSNLTVGFYLHGPPNIIEYKKIWKFGDGKQEKDLDLVKNHFYGNASPLQCSGSVTVMDMNEIKVYAILTFQIAVGKHVGLYIANFYQTEGVIFENSYVGFALAESQTPIDMTWQWDDNTTDGPLTFIPNPNHRYQSYKIDPPYCGSVTLRGTNDTSDSWSFAVMVLPDPTKELTGYIDIVSLSRWGSKIGEVGKNVTFTAQLSAGTPEISNHSYQFVWDFPSTAEQEILEPGLAGGAIICQESEGGRVFTCKFSSPGNYHVKCHITEPTTGININLSATLNVRDQNV